MSMQTPRKYEKKTDYASPIGILKNYNSGTLSKQLATNSHEEQFYKIKSTRLQAEVVELKEENAVLRSKLADASTNIQVLKERVFVLENQAERNRGRTVPSFVTDSNFNSGRTSLRDSQAQQSKFLSATYSYMDKTQRSANNSQIQRLTKQNRILKNEHQMQIDKFKNEIKLLNRRITEMSSYSRISPKKDKTFKQEDEESIKAKYQQKLEKQIQINQQLREQSKVYEEERKKMDERIKNQQSDIKKLKKQIEELGVIISSQNRSDRALTDLQIRNQELSMEIKKLYAINEGLKGSLSSSRRQNQEKMDNSYMSSEIKSKQISRVIVQNEEMPEQKVVQKLQNQIKSLRRQLDRSSDVIKQKNEEIGNMLTKLKPLLSLVKKNGNIPADIDLQMKGNRASLSILEVFLDRYRINSF